MEQKLTRRNFLRKSAAAGLVTGLGAEAFPVYADLSSAVDVRVGIIGLDTSHSIAFTKIINNSEDKAMEGFRVVAAWPFGSSTIESSYSRIPGYTEEIRRMGVEISGSLEDLLDMSDVVLLETNDGNLHLEQALQVFRAGKRVFIDKPVAASLKDAIAIYKAAEQYDVPVFSASSLRWARNAGKLRKGELIGRILGADTYSPAYTEPSHPDLFWYGIHGVEMLFTVMGTGCREVIRVHRSATDIVAGIWNDGRIGTFRGSREGNIGYGGTAFGEKGVHDIGPYDGYRPLMLEIIDFFKTGEAPVAPSETLEIFAFMEAADESKRRGGLPVSIDEVFELAADLN